MLIEPLNPHQKASYESDLAAYHARLRKVNIRNWESQPFAEIHDDFLQKKLEPKSDKIVRNS